MLGFFVIYVIIGVIVIGYDVICDVRGGTDYRILLSLWQLILLCVLLWPFYIFRGGIGRW